MINSITQLASNGIWQDVNTINTVKSSNPLIGEVYYDVNKKRIYIYENCWKELKVAGRNALFNKERMRKINNIFNERL